MRFYFGEVVLIFVLKRRVGEASRGDPFAPLSVDVSGRDFLTKPLRLHEFYSKRQQLHVNKI